MCWLNRRNKMGEKISDKNASKDSYIFAGQCTVLNSKALIKKPIKVEKEKLQEQESFFDGAKEIKRKE